MQRRRPVQPLWIACLCSLALSSPAMAQTTDPSTRVPAPRSGFRPAGVREDAAGLPAGLHEPSFYHGFAKVVGGVLFELPKTVVEATMENPPVVGTVMGVLAGTARAFQTTFSGLAEMAAGFDPWGSKQARRR